MSKFEVGQRVRAYGTHFFEGKATEEESAFRIEGFDREGWLEGFDRAGKRHLAHPKQCRRLKPRRRRDFWIEPNASADSSKIGVLRKVLPFEREGYIHVREVKP